MRWWIAAPIEAAFPQIQPITRLGVLLLGLSALCGCGLGAPDAFLDALRQHCGQAFAGRIVTNVPAELNDPFEGKQLVMHMRECAADCASSMTIAMRTAPQTA